jgi:hypothetical protein
LRAVSHRTDAPAADRSGPGLRLGRQGESLDRMQIHADPPALAAARPIESGAPRTLAPAPTSGVAAFLDGIQRTRIVGHWDGVPLLHAVVAAAVRRRVERKLVSWGEPVVHGALYAPRALLGESRWAQLAAVVPQSLPVIDVSTPDAAVLLHPLSVRARALELVALERERAERTLAASWCARMTDWLWIDGGMAGNVALDWAATAFGVVKSHTTLYGDGDRVRDALLLRAGQRSPVMLVGRTARREVASWYLRLRDSEDGDPLHGLVRVEVVPPPGIIGDAPDPAAVAALSATADRLSAWILAERAPLSLPDHRWDTLTYGVHACEAYLDALVGR